MYIYVLTNFLLHSPHLTIQLPFLRNVHHHVPEWPFQAGGVVLESN